MKKKKKKANERLSVVCSIEMLGVGNFIDYW